MKEPGVVGFYGYSGSGKTTLIEAVCRDLAERGLRLAVIKQTDQPVRMDHPGKDTYRFQDAGAKVVVLASKSETDIIVGRIMDIHKIIDMIRASGDIDLIIVESANDPHIPKIRLGRIEERPNTIWTYNGNYEKLLELIDQS